MTLRTRLILWNVGVTSAVILVAGVTTLLAVRQRTGAQLDRNLMERAQRLLSPREGPPEGGPPPGGRGRGRGPGGPGEPMDPGMGPGVGRGMGRGGPGLQSLMREGPQNTPSVNGSIDPESEAIARLRRPIVISQSGEVWGPPGVAQPYNQALVREAFRVGSAYGTTVANGRRIRVLALRVADPGPPPRGDDPQPEEPPAGRPPLVVQVAHELDDLERVLREITQLFLILTPVALLLSVAGGVLVARGTLRPVQRLRDATKRIHAENLAERIPVPNRKLDELDELAQEFNGMLGRLQASYERQRQFVGDASHELRTPIARIQLIAGASLAHDTEPAEFRQSLADVESSAIEMTRMVKQMLELARADGGTLPLERLNLVEVVSSLEATYAGAHPGLRWPAADSAGDLILGNRDGVAQIVRNLVDNAIRYTPQDRDIRVIVSGTVLSVEDQGSGMSADQIAHLGERFYRSDESRTRPSGGAGLGLAIVRSLAEAMGAQVSASSTPRGTRVSVSFPKLA